MGWPCGDEGIPPEGASILPLVVITLSSPHPCSTQLGWRPLARPAALSRDSPRSVGGRPHSPGTCSAQWQFTRVARTQAPDFANGNLVIHDACGRHLLGVMCW